MRIGILTGSGDVPGLNACIRSVVLSASDLGWEVLGFRRGWDGVLKIDPDDRDSIAEIESSRRVGRRDLDRRGPTATGAPRVHEHPPCLAVQERSSHGKPTSTSS